MRLFEAWQDTISLLAGARPPRTPRPGERFEAEAPPLYATDLNPWNMPLKEVKMDSRTNAWGMSSCIDLYACDLNLMQDEAAIKRFVRELCALINMRRCDETQVVRFGDDPRVTGFSMTQLIETSLISAHFADRSRAIYLDVFSCAPYDPHETAHFAAGFFKAPRHRVQIITRL